VPLKLKPMVLLEVLEVADMARVGLGCGGSMASPDTTG
jgi:hypothetical protein